MFEVRTVNARDRQRLEMQALEALLKPCVALNFCGTERFASLHDVLWVLAVALRDHVGSVDELERVIRRWAQENGVAASKVRSAMRSALLGGPSNYKYKPPGLRTRGKYAEVLQPICDAVGCPANCPAFSDRVGPHPGETEDRYEALGWPRGLRRRGMSSCDAAYRAVCERERELRLAAGTQIYMSYQQVADRADFSKPTAGKALTSPAELGLIEFKRGSGSGPYAPGPSSLSRPTHYTHPTAPSLMRDHNR